MSEQRFSSQLETSMDHAIADAKALGVQYLGTAGIPYQGTTAGRSCI